MSLVYLVECINQRDVDPARRAGPSRLFYGGKIRLHRDHDAAEAVARDLNENDFGRTYIVREFPEANLDPDMRRLFWWRG